MTPWGCKSLSVHYMGDNLKEKYNVSISESILYIVRFYIHPSFLFFFSLMLSTKRAELEIVPFILVKKWVISMSEVIKSVLTFLIAIGIVGFAVIVIILNNIDEFIDWLEKKTNKR